MNSMLYGEALGKRKIPFYLHIFPHAPHGLGLSDRNEHCKEHPCVSSWKDSFLKWIDYKGWK